MVVQCMICSEPFEFVPSAASDVQYADQEFFRHLNDCLRREGYKSLPSANPGKKRRTFPIMDDEGCCEALDLRSEFLQHQDRERLIVFFQKVINRWNYLERGELISYLTDVKGLNAPLLGAILGMSESGVRLCKKRTLDRFRAVHGPCSCECSRAIHRTCPHRAGSRLLSRALDHLWQLIEQEWRKEGA
jgi:hypothetical protein